LAHPLTRPALAKHDASLGEIIRGKFNLYPITCHSTDAETPHLTGRIGDQAVVVIQMDAKAPIWENFLDGTVEDEQFFLRQAQADSSCVAEKRPRWSFVTS
jgi:hypothetical protein